MKAKQNKFSSDLRKGDSQYRVLKTVKIVNGEGMGAEIDFGYHIKQFKCRNGCEHHNHLICMICNNYIYVDSMPLEDLQDKLAKDQGFIPKKHKFQVYGVCANCR